MNGSYALMGSSAIIRHVQHLVYKVAESNTAILITGELGAMGKDAIAKIIHEKSLRSKIILFQSNAHHCLKNPLEYDLFGYEVGALQGTNQARAGYFVEAEGGTLYIDEVGKLSPKFKYAIKSDE